MFKRLSNDFQLSILTFMAFFGVAGITPYAIYRLLQGNWLVGIVDSLMVLGALSAVAYAWRTGDTVKPGIALAMIVSFGAVPVAINLGVDGLFWIYVVILFNFFMVSPRKALLLTLLLLSSLISYALLIPHSVFASHYQMMSFIVTALTASALAFIFAFRMRSQRDQLQLLSTLDPLTGAGNRRSMDEQLKTARAAQRRHHTPYGVLIMDMDHFKRVNDQFGHAVGDRVLVDFVQQLKSISRQEDQLYRLGGEEFLLLLPNIDLAGLGVIAKKIREHLAQRLHRPNEAITVSIGGALLHSGESIESWLKRADDHLYQAKSTGRDRAIIETASEPDAILKEVCH
ncbi:MAG: GGDEF domain-containing protein [Pseudomonas sp.]